MVSKADNAASEFYFTREGVNYIAFPTGIVKKGSDVFDVLNRDNDDFVGSFLLSPIVDVVDGFNEWFASARAVE